MDLDMFFALLESDSIKTFSEENKDAIGGNANDAIERSKRYVDSNHQILMNITSYDKTTQKPNGQCSRHKLRCLSYEQQHIIKMHYADNAAFCNVAKAWRLAGELDYMALVCALSMVVERHEVLRTSYKIGDTTSLDACVRQDANISLPVKDLAVLPDVSQREVVRTIISAELEEPFDLADNLKLRGRLLRLSDKVHVFVLTMHGIAVDEASESIINHELKVLYSAFSQYKPSPLAMMTYQYNDFVQKQQQSTFNERYSKHIRYWQQQLQSAPKVHGLKLDYVRPSKRHYKSALLKMHVDEEKTRHLKVYCHMRGVTVFLGLHTALSALLYQETGQTDIVIGGLQANRNEIDMQGVVGAFSNIVPLRSDISQCSSFEQLLQLNSKIYNEASLYQELPFSQLVELLQLDNDSSYNPLFQIMLILKHTRDNELTLPGLTVTSLHAQQSHPMRQACDLVLSVEDSQEFGLSLNWEYNAALFKQDTISKIAINFMALLDKMLYQSAGFIVRSEAALNLEKERAGQDVYGSNSNYC